MTLYMKFVSLRPKFIISFMIGVDLFSGVDFHLVQKWQGSI